MSRKTKSGYLERLPDAAQVRGDPGAGEVGIVTRRTEVEEIQSDADDGLTGSALGKNGKRVGILLEDSVHMIVRDAVRYPSGASKCQMRIIGKTEYDGPNGVAVLCFPTANSFSARFSGTRRDRGSWKSLAAAVKGAGPRARQRGPRSSRSSDTL